MLVTYVLPGLGSGRGTLPFLLGSAPLPRSLLRMDNALAAFSDLALISAESYGKSTPFPKFRHLFLRLAHKAGNKKAVRPVFPWRTPDYALCIIC